MNATYNNAQSSLVRQLLIWLAVGIILPSVSAEITGSGDQVTNCDGWLSFDYFVDLNENGLPDTNEPPVTNVAVAIKLADQPQLGTEILHSDENGNVLFTNLCDNLYAVTSGLGAVSADAETVVSTMDREEADAISENLDSVELLITEVRIGLTQSVAVPCRFIRTTTESGFDVVVECAPELSEQTQDY